MNKISIALLLFSLSTNAFADAYAIESDLLRSMDKGIQKQREETKKMMEPLSDTQNEQSVEDITDKLSEYLTNKEEKDTDSIISNLVDEVTTLKSKVVLAKAVAIHTERPSAQKRIGSKTVYGYQEGKIYEVHAAVDHITDIALEPGEILSGSPLAGDTVRWKIALVTSGTPKGERQHVIVKPLEEDIATNLILTSNKRTYHLKLLAGDIFMPSVTFSYPEDSLAQNRILRKQEPKEEAALFSRPEDLRFTYRVRRGESLSFRPVRVFDDGVKTYLQMPEDLRSSEAPALFVLSEDDEPQLVNYRVVGHYYIVDRLFERAELRVGKEDRVEIWSNRYRPGFFERLF